VGLSNWVLDSAKMNRAVCLQRPDPTEADMAATGGTIVQTSDGAGGNRRGAAQLNTLLSPMASAFHEVYTAQGGRDFIGMRDYYQLLKLLRKAINGTGSGITPAVLTHALCRSFGGKPELLLRILRIFHAHVAAASGAKQPSLVERVTKHQAAPAQDRALEAHEVPPTVDLIASNLGDRGARHLMCLTRNAAALPLLLGSGLVDRDPTKTRVLVGSEFPDDAGSELYLVTQVHAVKAAMAEGKTLMLVNHDHVFEALYDVLNQRYLSKTDPVTGVQASFLRLAIGTRSQLCPVAPGFRIVVVTEQDHAYGHLDLALLNR